MTPEEKIKEQRIIEATRKGYMGMNGKFGVILKYLGQPIIAHSSPLYDVTYLEDDLVEQEQEDEIGYFDENEMVAEIGQHFDGLNRGVHMEIQYKDNALTVYFKGYPVYVEISGDLECFVPYSDWEEFIEKFYEVAIKLQRKDRKNSKGIKEQIKEANRKDWLQKIWRKWGFKL